MSCRLDIMGSIPTKGFPWITYYAILVGGSCIRGLLPNGGFKGPCLGEGPRDKKKKNQASSFENVDGRYQYWFPAKNIIYIYIKF